MTADEARVLLDTARGDRLEALLVTGLMLGLRAVTSAFSSRWVGIGSWAQMRRNGEKGMGLAATGMALGYLMVAFWILLFIGFLADDGSTA